MGQAYGGLVRSPAPPLGAAFAWGVAWRSGALAGGSCSFSDTKEAIAAGKGQSAGAWPAPQGEGLVIRSWSATAPRPRPARSRSYAQGGCGQCCLLTSSLTSALARWKVRARVYTQLRPSGALG